MHPNILHRCRCVRFKPPVKLNAQRREQTHLTFFCRRSARNQRLRSLRTSWELYNHAVPHKDIYGYSPLYSPVRWNMRVPPPPLFVCHSSSPCFSPGHHHRLRSSLRRTACVSPVNKGCPSQGISARKLLVPFNRYKCNRLGFWTFFIFFFANYEVIFIMLPGIILFRCTDIKSQAMQTRSHLKLAVKSDTWPTPEQNPHILSPRLTPVLLFPLAPPLSIGTCGDIMTRSLSALSARGSPYKCETQPSLRCRAFLRAFVQRHSSHKTPPGPSEALLSKP